MQAQPFKSRALVDYLFDFSKGVNNEISPALLPRDQMAYGSNTTVRGSFVGPRPYFRKIALVGNGYGGEAAIAELVAGRYQFGCYYKPDNGPESLVLAVSGKLYRLEIGETSALVDRIAPDFEHDTTANRHWCWQAEQYVIWNDSLHNPIFWQPPENGPTVQSNFGVQLQQTARNLNAFVIPAIGAEVSVPVQFSNVTDLTVGAVVTHRYRGMFTVQAIAGNNVTLLNATATPEGQNIGPPADDRFSWVNMGTQLPPGRMGVYGKGRNWVCLTDGRQFVASDLVGGSSGTQAAGFRDAVLEITENLFLAGGGNFAVPGPYGEIRAMVFSETLDTSLGQGALQVYTPSTVFSCDAPVDRSTWQDVTNPILTESAKGGGGLSHWSTINSNSDILSRSYDGIRSFILARREFNTWGNVPVSREIKPQLDRDSEDLLGYTSAVVFDNRHLMTTEGALVEGRGVIWKRLTALNHDPVSSLAGKSSSVYDALFWRGVDVLQLFTGTFSQTERCFAFTLNDRTQEFELWELLKSNADAICDDVDTRVTWSFESACIDFDQKNPAIRERLRLGPSEISVDNLRGKVSFEAYFRPDFYPCWVPWAAWEECSENANSEIEPGFRPNMGLPEPDPGWCDETNNRPLREGYTFRVKLVVTGHCKVTGWKLTADTVPQPPVAPPVCTSICP